MHKYLGAVGFSKIRTRNQAIKMLTEVIEHPDETIIGPQLEDGTFMEYIKYYCQDVGIGICGQLDDTGRYHIEFYYPFFRDKKVTTTLPLTIERHYDNNAFSGACDDLRIGVTLIFFMQRPVEYMNLCDSLGHPDNPIPIVLTGLSTEGSILLPLEKDKEAVMVDKELSENRRQLMEAAMDGDEDAMESLTKDEMETYTFISDRIQKDDIFSIVDSYFMPFGIESDQYKIMGEIIDLRFFTNKISGEELVRMILESNDLQYDIVINRNDLIGEPKVGRRFKGVIWLQGRISYNALKTQQEEK